MRINVFGSTTTALVTAACLAETGNDVSFIGALPTEIAEPGLEKLLEQELAFKRLQIVDTFDPAAEFHVIAVGTGECHSAIELAKQMAGNVSENSIALIRANLSWHLVEELTDTLQLPFVINPDFAAEGNLINGFVRPDRIIVGSDSEEAIEQVKRLYAPFNRFRDVMIEMSPESAVLTKYATNALIATRISLMNEFASVAEAMGADIEEVRHGLGSDKRIGFSYLYPGVGFGGDYLDRDLERLQLLINETGSTENLLQAVRNINHSQKELLFRKLWQHYNCNLSDKKVALWGISYKPNTNSIDQAPSLIMIQALVHQGTEVHVYDPNLDQVFTDWLAQNLNDEQRALIHIHPDKYSCVTGCDAVCVITEWKLFWTPDFAKMKELMRSPVVLDGRNLYDKDWMIDNGFAYYGVGR